MPKIRFFLILKMGGAVLWAVLALFVAAGLAKANGNPTSGSGVMLQNPLSVNSIEELINKIAGQIFYFALLVAPLMIVAGAFLLLTSAGNPNKVILGQKIILWTVVGVVVIFLSKVLIGLVSGFLTV